MTGLSDSFQRPINYLRISVTDRCNLRCIYCMPPDGISPIHRDDVLSFEEIYKVVQVASELGITKVRLTGGEPLVRTGLVNLVAMLRTIDALDDISLTTNGVLLGRYAEDLKKAGLKRVNVSLDTLQPEKFERISRCGQLEAVLDGIAAAHKVGLQPVKINTVVMRDINDDELLDFAHKSQEGWHVRFIELMPFSQVEMPDSSFISVAEIQQRLSVLGKLEPCRPSVGNGPARYFKLPGAKGSIGFISPVSEHFCFNCNRLRLTADGKLRPCLLSDEEIELRPALQQPTTSALKEMIEKAVTSKPQSHCLAEGLSPKGRPMTQVGG